MADLDKPFFMADKPGSLSEAAKLKRKAMVMHFSEDSAEEEELDKPETQKAQIPQKGPGAAPEKDTSVIFGPVRTATLKTCITNLHIQFNFNFKKSIL